MNNFDTSSQGVELDLICYLDDGHNRFDQENTLLILQHDSYSTNAIAVFHNGETEEYPRTMEELDALSENKYIVIESRGYSQGDYVLVIVPEEVVAMFEHEVLKEYIGQLLWDSPARCVLIVNGEEYYLDEDLTDLYKWDKDEVIEGVKFTFKEHEKGTYIIEWLTDNLPDFPEHSG